jgi:hypothetical protein
MTQGPVRQEVLRVGDSDVLITFPADMSRKSIDDLKAQFDLFIEKLRCPDDADRQAFLRCLAELAAYDAARGREGNAST